MASSGKIEINKFNGQRFELWKLKMENLLVDKYEWITVDSGAKPTEVSDQEWKKLERKAKNTIRLGVSYSVLLNVLREATTKALWNKKEGHYKRDYKSKAPHKERGYDDAPSAEAKTTSDEGGDMYLASSSTHVDHEAWLIDSGNDRKARIIGCGKVKLKLQGGRVRTLLGVLHIRTLARNLISVSKMDDVGVKIVFEKDTYKMVRGALILMRGVWIRTLYKLQGNTVVDGCNNFVVPESGAENLVVSGEKTML
eukprot:PITA_22008